MGRIQPIIFVNHVKCACVAPAMVGELCKRIQHCCATLRRSDRTNKEMLGVSQCFRSLTDFKLCATTLLTICNRVFKRSQHLISYNVGSCWPTMLRLFARSFSYLDFYNTRLSNHQTTVFPWFSPTRPLAWERGRVTKGPGNEVIVVLKVTFIWKVRVNNSTL